MGSYYSTAHFCLDRAGIEPRVYFRDEAPAPASSPRWLNRTVRAGVVVWRLVARDRGGGCASVLAMMGVAAFWMSLVEGAAAGLSHFRQDRSEP